MSLTLPKMCSMGSSQLGLVGTIGITILNADGTTHAARATANIYEIGGGCYGKDCTFDDDFKGSLVWDTGGGSPYYAVEEYDRLAETIDGTVSLLQLLRHLLSFVGGKTTGGGTANVRFLDNADTKARIHMEVDNNGNRTTVTLDGT